MAEPPASEHKQTGEAPSEEVAFGQRAAYLRYRLNTGFKVNKIVHSWWSDEEAARSGKTPYSQSGDAPEPPASLDEIDDFVPQPMVSWYRPSELIKAGIEAVVSSVFGSYADKREIESVLTTEEWHDYAPYLKEKGEIWIDYIADLGDGFDATYTMARLLAEKELDVNDGTTLHKTRRGHILVMGGDEVYPTSKPEEYNNRMREPYRYALPYVDYAEQAPHLFLIPGNHDWYDGLDSFFKFFCHGDWIGGWKTWQRRSYFALKIDEKLWLWGIDIQLSSNIDQPQLDYFEHIAKEEMAQGSKIILCTAEPSWVYVDAKAIEAKKKAKKEAKKNAKKSTEREKKHKYKDELKKKKKEIYHNLGHLEKKIIHRYGHEMVVGLAGDWHNYTRYVGTGTMMKDDTFEASDKNYQRFVSGGGGAYLYPTHNMPDRLEVPIFSKPKNKTKPEPARNVFEQQKIFPNSEASKSLANRSLLLPFFRLNWYFTAFLGAFYLLLAWIIQSVSKIAFGLDHTLMDVFNDHGFLSGLNTFVEVILHSPESMVFLSVLVVGLMAFSNYESWAKKIPHGGLHGLAHVALFLGLIYCIAKINLGVLVLPVTSLWQAALFGVEMLVFGGFLGGWLFGFYLWFSNKALGIHDNEVLLCQSHPDYKNFLRFHIKPGGQITIYPIGVKRVVRKSSWSFNKMKRNLAAWALRTDATGGASWIEPREGVIQDYAQLIEEPITLSFSTDTTTEPSTPQTGATG